MTSLLSTAPRRCALYVAITLPVCWVLAGDLYLTSLLLAPMLFALLIGSRVVVRARRWEAMSMVERAALARRRSRRFGLAAFAAIATLGLLIIAGSLYARWELGTTDSVVHRR